MNRQLLGMPSLQNNGVCEDILFSHAIQMAKESLPQRWTLDTNRVEHFHCKKASPLRVCTYSDDRVSIEIFCSMTNNPDDGSIVTEISVEVDGKNVLHTLD
jgi:hypothetical protein